MRKIIGVGLILSLLIVPLVASAAQNHSIPNGYNLYSMTYRSMDDDNGICYQGATNWKTAAGTTMTHSDSSLNQCYYRSYLETWYGQYSKDATTRFTIRINEERISDVYSGNIWNAAVSVSTHEFGHAQYLGDHDTEGEGVYSTTSVMSYDRDRTSLTRPGSHDLDDLYDLRNP